MSMYEKPVISVDTGMAEGVYAASGSSSSKLSISVTNTTKWNETSGQKDFSIDTTGVEDGKTTIILTFNNAISGFWSDGASSTFSGNTGTLSWSGGISKGTIAVHVQVSSSSINDLEITSYKVE